MKVLEGSVASTSQGSTRIPSVLVCLYKTNTKQPITRSLQRSRNVWLEESSLEWKPFLSDIMAQNYPPSSSLWDLASIFHLSLRMHARIPTDHYRRCTVACYLFLPSFLPSSFGKENDFRDDLSSVFFVVDGR